MNRSVGVTLHNNPEGNTCRSTDGLCCCNPSNLDILDHDNRYHFYGRLLTNSRLSIDNNEQDIHVLSSSSNRYAGMTLGGIELSSMSICVKRNSELRWTNVARDVNIYTQGTLKGKCEHGKDAKCLNCDGKTLFFQDMPILKLTELDFESFVYIRHSDVTTGPAVYSKYDFLHYKWLAITRFNYSGKHDERWLTRVVQPTQTVRADQICKIVMGIFDCPLSFGSDCADFVYFLGLPFDSSSSFAGCVDRATLYKICYITGLEYVHLCWLSRKKESLYYVLVYWYIWHSVLCMSRRSQSLKELSPLKKLQHIIASLRDVDNNDDDVNWICNCLVISVGLIRQILASEDEDVLPLFNNQYVSFLKFDGVGYNQYLGMFRSFSGSNPIPGVNSVNYQSIPLQTGKFFIFMSVWGIITSATKDCEEYPFKDLNISVSTAPLCPDIASAGIKTSVYNVNAESIREQERIDRENLRLSDALSSIGFIEEEDKVDIESVSPDEGSEMSGGSDCMVHCWTETGNTDVFDHVILDRETS